VANDFQIPGFLNFAPADIILSLVSRNSSNLSNESSHIEISPIVTLSRGSYEVVGNSSSTAVIFEPASILLLGSGLAGLGFVARRKT
jgi:hypothetical protein